MNFPNNYNDQSINIDSSAVSRSFVANVFSYMTLALVITGVAAYWFAASGNMLALLQGSSILLWGIMLAPIGMVLIMSFAFNRLSFTALMGLFLAYSLVNGISLSVIFLVYSSAAISKVFFITAGLFATMAVVGYTTKTDLTKLGSILMMAVLGIVIASLVNYFLESAAFDYLISCVGVLVFTGLVAYDTQKVKRIGAGVEYGTATAGKLALMGALSLYLDFINLFLFLLRVFGGRRD
ncbi:MAG: Bax inhibitor-1/YccA family protein [Flavobacteriales bacterium]|jgi:FtsH-binding integral membrane protein